MTAATPRTAADAVTEPPSPSTPAAVLPASGRLRDHKWLLLLVVLAQVVVLQLVLRTPFLGDDAPIQIAQGYAESQGQTLLEFVWFIIMDQFHGLGRFMPFGHGAVFLTNGWLHDRVLYKAILVALTIASTLALARTLMGVRIPGPVALLGAGLAAPAWQLHAYHDPLVSYGAITQLVLILACAATLCHLRWLRGGSTWWAVATILFLISANFTYEAGFLMVGMVVGATLAVGGRLRTAAPAVIVMVTALLIAAAGRPDTGGYSMSLAPGPVLTTVAKQLVAAAPGSSWLDAIGAKIRPSTGSQMAWVRALLAALLLLPVLRAALRTEPLAREQGFQRPLGLLMLLGTPAVLPAATVALAAKYQVDIRWGVAYLPLALTVAALASTAGLLLWWLGQRVPKRIVVGAGFAAILVGTWASTSASMRLVSADYAYARTQDELPKLARHGAFDAIPTSTTILFSAPNFQPPNGIWLVGYLYSPSNWLYTHAHHKRWPSFPVPAGAVGELCVDTYGSPIEPPCPRIKGAVEWATTGLSFEKARWLLLTAAPAPAATDDLSALPATGPATLFYPADRKPPTVQYVVDPAAPPVTVDPATLRRLPGDVDDWARYSVPLPKGAHSGTGSVR